MLDGRLQFRQSNRLVEIGSRAVFHRLVSGLGIAEGGHHNNRTTGHAPSQAMHIIETPGRHGQIGHDQIGRRSHGYRQPLFTGAGFLQLVAFPPQFITEETPHVSIVLHNKQHSRSFSLHAESL